MTTNPALLTGIERSVIGYAPAIRNSGYVTRICMLTSDDVALFVLAVGYDFLLLKDWFDRRGA